MNTDDRQQRLTLDLLESIDRSSQISQRSLAKYLGVALGVANSYLRRCINKGLIKVEQAPANRYLYYLTPKGFSEKAKLSAQYISFSLTFYRRASISCLNILSQCKALNCSQVILCGVSDLAEVFYLWAKQEYIEVLGIYDPHHKCQEQFLRLVVWHELPTLVENEKIILTELETPNQAYQALLNRFGRERILVPSVLSI